MKVYIVGIGMGNPDTLTVGAKNAIENSDLLIGATRLLESFDFRYSCNYSFLSPIFIITKIIIKRNYFCSLNK